MTATKSGKPGRQVKCERCGRRYRGTGDWNVRVSAGIVVGLLCPDCQNADKNAEAVINEATLAYGVDAFGRLVGRSR